MSPSHYTIKWFLLEYIIFTILGFTFARSVSNVNNRPTPQFEPHFQSSLALHPFYYDHPNSQAYRPHEPVGTFYDSKRGILRSFPGGGVPVLVDHHKRCSSNFVGIKPHPNQRQYYYVCKSDCVIFGKCQNLQSFDATKAQCIPYPTPDYTPVCLKPGRFPILTDCTIYYRCDADLKPRIHSCPRNTIFSPHNEKCICGAHCNPTKVSLHGSYIPQGCEDKFPPCLQNGTFRTPTDCSLYYTCAKQEGSLYLQIRFKCPELEFFDPAQGTCRPQHEVACDSIQISDLVFPRPPPLPQLPVIYPAHYFMDSLDDSDYPTEYSLSCSKEDIGSTSVSSNERTISNSSVQTTKSSNFSNLLTTGTTEFPSHSITTKEASSLTISTSKQRVDTSSATPIKSSLTITEPTSSVEINTHTASSSTPIAPVLQTNLSPTGTSDEIIFSSTFNPTTPSLNPPIGSSSPDIISDQTSSPIDFVPSKIQTSPSTTTFSSTASSQTKHSTPFFTFVTMLPTNFSTTNSKSTSTAEITTTPLVFSSITPSSSTGFSSSTAKDRPLPTKPHTSASLINTLHMSSPTVHSSSVGILTTRTVPTSAFQPHTSLSITTLSSLDSTTTELPTIHSRKLFVENAIETSMPTDPSILSPATSSLKEEIIALPPNTAASTTFSVTTSSVLRDSPPLSTVKSTNETKDKPTVSTYSSEITPNNVTNTLNQNEIRSIRSSLLIQPVTSNESNAFEQTFNTEYNSNEFENLGYYDDYESDLETTEVSATDKLDDRRNPLNASEKSKIKGTEDMNLHDANDVSYYEENGDSFEVLSTSTVSALHEETLSTTQSTRLKLNITARSTKRNTPKYNFQLHNQSTTDTAYQQLNIPPNKLDVFNVEKLLFKNSSNCNLNDDLETITKKFNGTHNSFKNINGTPNDKELSRSTCSDIPIFEDSTDAELTTVVPNVISESIENATKISSNEYVLGSIVNLAITKPFSQTGSSFKTDNKPEDSMSTIQPLNFANQSTATEVESFTESNKAGYTFTFSKFQTSAENQISMTANSTKTEQGNGSASSSKVPSLVHERNDSDIPHTTMKTVKKEQQALATTEPTTLKIARQARDEIDNTFESDKTRLSKLLLDRSNEIKDSCTLLPLTPLKLIKYHKSKEIVGLNHNNKNSIDAYNSKFQAIVPSTFGPIRDADIENGRKFENLDQISKLVDIWLPPSTEKPSPQDLKMDQNSGCATTVNTFAERTHSKSKEFISKHLEISGIHLMDSVKTENRSYNLEKSTGLIKICNPLQNNISNEADKLRILKLSNSKSDKSRISNSFSRYTQA
nr:mucin-17-like isoform X3 [Bactrocera oleae]